VIIDSHHPLFWFDDCMNLSELRRALHTGFCNTLKILEDEGIAVYRLRFGTRHRYFIRRDAARPLVNRYGSESARKRRLSRSAAKPKGTPLWMACPYCKQKGKQWRSGLNTAGRREAKCGHCKRFYTIGKRPPLQSTCIHCGETTRQLRQQLTSAGNLTIRCGHCRRHYTVQGNPDAPPPEIEEPVVHQPWGRLEDW
jgi:hypothetical protein